MKKPITTTLAALVGALGIYCTQAVVTDAQNGSSSGPEGGPVGDAKAEPGSTNCCTLPVPKFKPLGTLTVSNTADSATLAVGAYREIVVYVTSTTGISGSCSGGTAAGSTALYFRADPGAPFGSVPGFTSGRIQVQGSDLQLRWSLSASCIGNATFAVAGVE